MPSVGAFGNASGLDREWSAAVNAGEAAAGPDCQGIESTIGL